MYFCVFLIKFMLDFNFLFVVLLLMCEKDWCCVLGWDNKLKDGVFVFDCKFDGFYNFV